MTSADRPPVTFERGPVTAFLRLLGPAIAAIGVLGIAVGYVGLPPTIPTHFGLTGEADSFGPRWSVLVLAAVWIVMQAGIAILAARPRLFNYPAPVTPANAQQLYREGERLMVWIGVALAATFAGMSLSLFGMSGIPLTVLGVIALVVVTLVGVVRSLRAGG